MRKDNNYKKHNCCSSSIMCDFLKDRQKFRNIRFIIGATGLTGPTGPTGPAPTLAIGTVTTGAPGSKADVTITPSKKMLKK